MNPEINDNEDIFDVAIGMQYFKNMRSSADNIHTYANHFLYRSVYKKLLSFSKKELETTFWNTDTKEFHDNPKAKQHDIKFSKNIFEATRSLDNPLFFAAFIEKGVFKEYYHPVVKSILKIKKSNHSLDFLQTLYHIQTSHRMNDPKGSMKNFLDFDNFIFHFVKALDTEEKNEVFMIFIDSLIKKNPEDFVTFILDNISYFNDEHLLLINSNIKKHNIDINQYNLFEQKFPKEKDSFFINSGQHNSLDSAYNFGFRATNYQYKNLNLVSAIYSHGLNGNTIGDTWQTSFIKKVLIDSDLGEIDNFITHVGTEPAKLKKYGHHFENIGKEALNHKLHNNLPNLAKVKQPKI